MKKGLIIQGPIISKGRTGKTANITSPNLSPEDIVSYDCCENIFKTFENFNELFDHIVVVTWENQDKNLLNHLKSNLPNNCLLLIKDTTKPIPIGDTLVPGNNKYRLFLSLLEGTKFLSALGCEVIFKVRTDQFLDLNFFVSDTLQQLSEERRNVILVPWVNIIDSYTVLEIPDHYFSARTQDMLDFTKEFLTFPEMSEHVHTDIFFKWSLRNLTLISPVREYIKSTSRFGNNIFLRMIINPFISNGFFKPLDKNILNSLYWRGEKLDIQNIKFSEKEVIYSRSKSTGLIDILLKVKNKIFIND